MSRTLKVFNDTRSSEPILAECSFRLNGKIESEGQEISVPPGTAFEFKVSFKAPTTPKRVQGEVVLTCKRGGKWLAPEPQGLSGAAVAWAAPLPSNPKRHAVVYQMSWTNPRPGEEIRSIDVRYGENADVNLGIPIVLAITGGSARK